MTAPNEIVLGIETSCDETAAAVVRGDRTILSNVVMSQIADHRPYGGVVPEVAARAHLAHIDAAISRAMTEARRADPNVSFARLDAVAATAGPGLIGGVLVGVTAAKAVAAVHDTPFIPINHLEAHALTARLTASGGHHHDFPFLLLLVSGGHCQFLHVTGVGRYRQLGTTIDDAIGEAFDKAARVLGLSYPGGPAIEAAAATGDPARFTLPRPLRGRTGCDFSFSGLKTAVRITVDAIPDLTPQTVADVAASFQAAVCDVVRDRLDHALAACPGVPLVVAAGGVAANQALRATLAEVCAAHTVTLAVPPVALCTDNAAMVAWAGIENLRIGNVGDDTFAPRPRWPLSELHGELSGELPGA